MILILGLLGALIYLNRVGLPGFVKEPLLAKLRANGVALDFSSLRFDGFRIVGENLTMLQAQRTGGPYVSVKQAEVRLDHEALKHLEIEPRSLILEGGRIDWPLRQTNGVQHTLTIQDIMTELRFLPDDQWELDHFQAKWLGGRITLLGTVKNASLLRSWKFPSGNKGTGVWQQQLSDLLAKLEGIRFKDPPGVRVKFLADGRDPKSIAGELSLGVNAAKTTWGTLEQLSLVCRWTPMEPDENASALLKLDLGADGFRSWWGYVKNGSLAVSSVVPLTNAFPTNADWRLSARRIDTKWGKADNLKVSGQTRRPTVASQAPRPDSLEDALTTSLEAKAEHVETSQADAVSSALQATVQHSLTNWLPTEAEAALQLGKLRTSQGQADQLSLNTHARRLPTDRPTQSDPSWGWWSKLEPFAFDWKSEIVGLARTNLQIETLHSEGQWSAPSLEVIQLRAALFGKSLETSARLNVATRRLTGETRFDFDVHRLSPLLNEKAQRWLDRYQWETPPQVRGEASLTLPAWTNREPDWRGEVRPSLQLTGSFDVGSAAFKTVPLLSAHSHFSFSNLLWHLPDLVVQRPEGQIDLRITHNSSNEQYFIGIFGRVMAKDIGPLIGKKAREVLDLFEFHEPTFANCLVCGPWSEGEKQSVVGVLTLTNFNFRGEHFDRLDTRLLYTNRFLAVSRADIRREPGRLVSSGVGYNFDSHRLFLTNAQNTIDPLVVARVISPKFAGRLAPYRFGRAPNISAYGTLQTGEPLVADLQFDIQGGPFSWWKFNLPQISGSLRWAHDSLVLTNLSGVFYNGQFAGNAQFDLRPTNGTPFKFNARTAQADLRLLMHDLTPKTNNLEGLISGELSVVAANTADWQSWQGLGNVSLRDGLIWEIPMFGILSPVLNSFWPGLGNTRADQGTASFAITNSVVTTRDLEIHSALMRLHYDGTIDFQGRVNARAEAELLRDAWLLGPFLSAALSPFTKLFEFKVTGTLNHPKKEPLYIPKVFMMPFHPIRSLKEIFSDQETPSPPPANTSPQPQPQR